MVRASLVVAGFLSSIVTVRLLGPAGRGEFFYWSTLAALAIQFGNLGLHSGNTYYLAKGKASLSTLATNSLWFSVILGITLGVLLTTVLLLQGQTLQNKWLFFVPTVIMIPSGLYFLLGTNLLIAQGRIEAYNCFELMNRWVGFCVVLFACWFWSTPESILAALSIVSLVICLPLYRCFPICKGWSKVDLKLVRGGFSYALRAYVVATLGFLVLRLNVVLLEFLVDSASLGIYSVAVQLLDVINMIPATVALVLFPRIMQSSAPYRLMQVNLYGLTGILALLYFSAFCFGRDLIILLYGGSMSGAYDIFLWGLPGSFCFSLTGILSQYLAAIGIPLVLIWIWLFGLALEFGLSIWLMPAYGGIGAIVSLSVTYMTIFFLVFYLTKSIEGKNLKNRGSRNAACS